MKNIHSKYDNLLIFTSKAVILTFCVHPDNKTYSFILFWGLWVGRKKDRLMLTQTDVNPLNLVLFSVRCERAIMSRCVFSHTSAS